MKGKYLKVPVLHQGSWGWEGRRDRHSRALKTFPGGNDRMPVSRDHRQPLLPWIWLPCISQLLQKCEVRSPMVPHPVPRSCCPGGPLEGLCLRVSWFTAAGRLSNQLQCLPRDQPWSAQLGHHTGPHAHASQGDTVEPGVPGSSHGGRPAVQGMAAGRKRSGCGRAALSFPGGPREPVWRLTQCGHRQRA